MALDELLLIIVTPSKLTGCVLWFKATTKNIVNRKKSFPWGIDSVFTSYFSVRFLCNQSCVIFPWLINYENPQSLINTYFSYLEMLTNTKWILKYFILQKLQFIVFAYVLQFVKVRGRITLSDSSDNFMQLNPVVVGVLLMFHSSFYSFITPLVKVIVICCMQFNRTLMRSRHLETMLKGWETYA